MPIPELSDEEILVAYLLAAFLDHGPVVQFDTDTLAEAIARVIGGKYKFDMEEAPDGSVIMRLRDE